MDDRLAKGAPRLAEAAKALLLAQRTLDKHPANDATKAFDRKLTAVELATTELVAALEAATGVNVIDEATEAEWMEEMRNG